MILVHPEHHGRRLKFHCDCDRHGRLTTAGNTTEGYALGRAESHRDEGCGEMLIVVTKTASRWEVWHDGLALVGTRSSKALALALARRHEEGGK